MEEINLRPVAYVISAIEEPADMPLGGIDAIIEVLPEYNEALEGLEDNSNIWILSWLHKAQRDVLKSRPGKVNSDLTDYGVFALRTFVRPNPIGLTLVKLERVEGNIVYVRGLDAVDKTPILDIKPYLENDSIFSPRIPYIRGSSREMRQGMIKKHACAHHGEDCLALLIGVRMAAIAEDYFGRLTSLDLMIRVEGSACLADTIQGISRARLANPPRFTYINRDNLCQTDWKKGQQILTIRLKQMVSHNHLEELANEELFDISWAKA